MIMRNIIIVFALLFLLNSCQKEQDIRKITYQIGGLKDPYKVIYLNESGETITQTITPVSASKAWKLTFNKSEGEIVYLYLEHKEKFSPGSMSFYAGIYVDGKAYQVARSYDLSVGDTIFKIKRAGTVPFTNQ